MSSVRFGSGVARMSAAGVVAAAVAIVLIAAPLHAQQFPAEERAASIIGPSIVYIETDWRAWVQDHDGDWLNGGEPYTWTSRCSGFVVNPSGYVMTAGHCIDDGPEGARHNALSFGVEEWIQMGWAPAELQQDLYENARLNWHVEGETPNSPPDQTVRVMQGASLSGMEAGQGWPARVVEFLPWSRGDVALLKIEQANLPTALIARDADVRIGMSILSVGYPASTDLVTDSTFEPTFKDGRISSRTTRGDGLLPVYEMSAALSGGMSGGPTINLDGEVIGVNSFGILGEPQAFNFVSPASLMIEMLSRNGVSNELGIVDGPYHAGVAALFGGDHSSAIVSFDQVLERIPSHRYAQQLRTQALDLQSAAPPVEAEPSASTFALAGLAVVVLIGLAVAGTILVRRRRPQPAAGPAETDIAHLRPVDPSEAQISAVDPAPAVPARDGAAEPKDGGVAL